MLSGPDGEPGKMTAPRLEVPRPRQVLRSQPRGGKLAEGVPAFCGTLATAIVQLRPRDPESKGIVERHNGYFETSFMPGRSFASPADFNAQFTDWLGRANSRVVRTLQARPVDLIDTDRAAMLPLATRSIGKHDVMDRLCVAL
jgi:hypothetical protein